MDQKQKRLVFMGTPEFARIILEYVLEWPGGRTVAVYTQPDRPCGRGRIIKASPVKELALEKGLPVIQPENFKNTYQVERLASLRPDYLLVAAYGLILPQSVLEIPLQMPLNVHASLLPKYRGAAPIQRAIMNGESSTGISIMRMTRGLDSGPVVLQKAMEIDPMTTAGQLHDRLAHLGGEALTEALDRLKKGTVKPVEQDESQATYAPKLVKKDGEIDWNQLAWNIHNRIRGLSPWPGSFFYWPVPGRKTVRLEVFPGKIGPVRPENIRPGTIMGVRQGFLQIACRDNTYLVPRLKPGSGKEMDPTSFECGFLSRCP